MPARSVVASTLLGVRPPRLPTGLLVRSCGLFGLRPGTARVAISRMVAAGELVADEGGYALVGGLRERQARQELSRRAITRPWRLGDAWALAVVTAEARPAPDRAALRSAAQTLRLGELREGVWLRPDNVADASATARDVVASQCHRLRAQPVDDPVGLAARLWDLAGWAARALRLDEALTRSRPALDADDRAALPDAFVLSAAVLRHLQADPLLPDPLLPADWPGADLRRRYEAWSGAFDEVWTGWYRSARHP